MCRPSWARVRLLAAGDVNRDDPRDARSAAAAALRSAGVREVRADDHAAVLKVWSKRYRDLGRTRTRSCAACTPCCVTWSPAGSAGRSTRPALPGSSSRSRRRMRWRPRAASSPRRSSMTCAASMPGSARPATSSPLPCRQPAPAWPGCPASARSSPPPSSATFAACPASGPRSLRRLQRHRADPGVLRSAQDLPAFQAREPAARPRHPHGRGHPGPPPAQRRPRLPRHQAGRGQGTQTGAASAEAADQQRDLRLPAGRRPARRSPREGPGRAAGERLCRQRKPLPGPLTTLRPPAPRRPGPLGAPGRTGHSPVAATMPPAQPRVQAERPQRSEDEDLEVRQDGGHTRPRGGPGAKGPW
jgi:hypothetical protein